MSCIQRAFLVAVFLTVGCGTSFAQVATGTPPFGTVDAATGPDTIDLANLNVHISIPVLHRPGRGTNFTYDLSYDSSVWYPVTSGSTKIWQSVQNWGWRGQTEIATGYVSYATQGNRIGVNCIGTNYINFVYHDPWGVLHPFTAEATSLASGNYYNCGNHYFYGFTAVASDGSGYTLYIGPDSDTSGNWPGGKLYGKDGQVLAAPFNVGTGAASFIDRNGNEITTDGSGNFFDTLSSAISELTVSGTQTTAMSFSYNSSGPNVPLVSYKMVFSSYTVQTNFGCSNIGEMGATQEYLVSEIDLPEHAVNPNAKYTFTYEPTYLHSGSVTGRVASVTLPTGGTITYTYGTGGQNGIVCADGSASYLARKTPDTGTSSWVYAHSESGSAWTTTITDPTPQQNQTVLNFQGLYLTEKQVYNGAASPGNLMQTVANCYNGNTSNCNSTAITAPISQISRTVQLPGSLGPSKVVTSYDIYGDLTEKDEYDYGASTASRKTLISYANPGNYIHDRRSVVTVEDGATPPNIKSQTTVSFDGSTPTPTSGTPQHLGISGPRGNPTTVTYLVSGSRTLSRQFAYYDTGMISTATDMNSAQYSYSYGSASCGNSFPTALNKPLASMSVSFTLYQCPSFPVLGSYADENGFTTSFSYCCDTNPLYSMNGDYWVPQTSTDPFGMVAQYSYSTNSFSTSASGRDVTSSVDGLGRMLLRQVYDATNNIYDTVETDHNVYGDVSRVTLPYTTAIVGQTNSSASATSWVYDPLQRPTQNSNTGGTCNNPTPCRVTSYAYTGRDVYRTLGPAPTLPVPENAKRSNYEYDGLGRLTSVCEVTSMTGSVPCGQSSSNTGYWTRYKYDVLNNVIGICQNTTQPSTVDCVANPSAGQQTRTYSYDGMGRMTSETNPESGTTTYTYDSVSSGNCVGTHNGDLVMKLDASGNGTCYSWDAMHRLTSITQSYNGSLNAAATPDRCFVYDSATVNNISMLKVKDQLAEAFTTAQGSGCNAAKITDEGFSYTAPGQVSDFYEKTPNSAGYFHITHTYFTNGFPNQLSGLSGLPTMTNSLDANGRFNGVSSSVSPSPATGALFNAADLATTVNFGSLDNTHDSDSFGYDPNTNLMNQYTFKVNNQSLVGTLTWNAIGTLQKLVVADPFNASNTQTCNYSQDDLSRISNTNCTSNPAWSQAFSYDAFGNINKSGNSTFNPSYSPSTNHMTQIGSSTPTYDPDGNVTNDFLHSYAWDSTGLPVNIDNQVVVTYDALGRMVEQNRSGQYTQIVYSPFGNKLALMSGLNSLQKAYVPLPGGTMAVYNSSGLAYYRHSDWQGSSRLASTVAHGIFFDGAYAPFGELYANIGTNDLSFTGMNQDTVPNLYDFPGRRYGIQGRWPSPDPAGLSAAFLKDPQTLNRYAYVRNSPLNLIDAQGYCPSPTKSQQGPHTFQSCLSNGAVLLATATTALDTFGAIPLVGNVGKGIQLGASLVSAGISLHQSFGEAAVSSGSLGLAVADAEKLTGDIAVHGFELVPVLGNVVSGISALHDVFGKDGLVASFKACLNGKN